LHVGRAGISWHFFATGSRLLFDGDASGSGFSLYAQHPNLQIGPLSFVFAAPLRLADAAQGRVVAVVLLSAVGPLLLWLISRLNAVRYTSRRSSLILVGLLVLPVWSEVAVHYAHLDDVLALTFTVLALHALERQQGVLVGVLLACAVDSKPWAAPFVALILVLAPTRRPAAIVTWMVGVAVAWVPFLLVDSATTRAAGFSIPNAASSGLRALGVADARTPVWDRPLQLALGVLAAFLCVRVRRWPAVLFAVICVRIALDPQTYAYYTSGLVLAAAIVDLTFSRLQVPIYAASAVAAVYAARASPIGVAMLGQLRIAYCLLACASLFVFVQPRLGSRDFPGQTRRVIRQGRQTTHGEMQDPEEHSL
jgi:hypothetical protein